jgi:hypothetical protein
MIVEDEENEGLEPCFDATTIQIERGLSLVEYKNGIQETKNVDMNFKPQNDMIDHL